MHLPSPPIETGRYYLELGLQVKVVDIEVAYESDFCCEYFRLEEILVDGQPATLPLEITVH